MMLDEELNVRLNVLMRDLYVYCVHHMNSFDITTLVYLNNF